MTAFHLGALHPFEQALTLLLAFGPFVPLWIVVRRRRRQQAEETATAQGAAPDQAEGGVRR